MKKQMHLWMVVLAVVTLLTGMATGCGAATENAGSAQAVKNNTTGPVPNVAGGGAAQEGIKVHGHWIIEVRNPDGSLAERREFENALTSNGGVALANLLSRNASAGGWIIFLSNGNSILTPWTSRNACIGESTYNSPILVGTIDTTSLTVNLVGSMLVLSGTSAPADNNGVITFVSTIISPLSSSQPPASSYTAGSIIDFTQTQLSSPVSLTTGQTVLVTVQISFS